MFDKFLSGGVLEAGLLTIFFHKHLAQVACFIWDADPWFIQMNEMFMDIANDFSAKVKSGIQIEPEPLRAANEYAIREMETINMQYK